MTTRFRQRHLLAAALRSGPLLYFEPDAINRGAPVRMRECSALLHGERLYIFKSDDPKLLPMLDLPLSPPARYVTVYTLERSLKPDPKL